MVYSTVFATLYTLNIVFCLGIRIDWCPGINQVCTRWYRCLVLSNMGLCQLVGNNQLHQLVDSAITAAVLSFKSLSEIHHWPLSTLQVQLVVWRHVLFVELFIWQIVCCFCSFIIPAIWYLCAIHLTCFFRFYYSAIYFFNNIYMYTPHENVNNEFILKMYHIKILFLSHPVLINPVVCE